MVQLDDDSLSIFVDGSSLSKPRRGGVGIRFVWVDSGDEMAEDYPMPYSYEGGRIGQMELMACIDALKILLGRRPPVDPQRFRKVVIYTDSRYVAENYPNAKWGTWRQQGWRTRDGTPVHNKTEWEDLVRLNKRLEREKRLRLEIVRVPGKSDQHTKAVDKMAKKAAQSPLKARKLDHQRVRRKWSPQKLQRGAIATRGQQELIRLVTDVPMAGHRNLFHYIYEVVDDGSADFQVVDEAYSDTMLGAGHIYRVRFNNETRNPRIVDAEEIARDSTAGRYIAISCGQKDPEVMGTITPDTGGSKTPPEARFAIGDNIRQGKRMGSIRSMVGTSDNTFVYKLRWHGTETDDYLIEDMLEPPD